MKSGTQIFLFTVDCSLGKGAETQKLVKVSENCSDACSFTSLPSDMPLFITTLPVSLFPLPFSYLSHIVSGV